MSGAIYKNITAEGLAFGEIEINQQNPWASLHQARQNRLIIQGVVSGMEKHKLDGVESWSLVVFFETETELVKAIVPKIASGFETREEMERSIGRLLAFVVVAVDRDENLCILSRTEALEKMTAVTVKTVKIGDFRTAVVERVQRLRAILNIGGVTATLQKNEFSHSYIEDLRNVLHDGDNIEVKVIGIDENLKNASTVKTFQVSRKQTLPNPWKKVSQRYTVGGIYDGVITGIADTGAYIHVHQGIDAMGRHPIDGVLPVGTRVSYQVVSIDPESEKMNVNILKVVNR